MAGDVTYQRLAYEPRIDVDMLPEATRPEEGWDRPDPGWEHRTDTLARRWAFGKVQLNVHANIKIAALENSVPAPKGRYRVLRIRRVWSGALSPNPINPIVSRYDLDKYGLDGRLPSGFKDDSDLDGTPVGHWFDAPGVLLRPVRLTHEERVLNEFVVGIGEAQSPRTPVPGFGGVYFLVAIDVTQERYRIWMSLERRLSGDEIRGVFRMPGFACPPYISAVRPPDFAAFRYLPHEWEGWRSHLK